MQTKLTVMKLQSGLGVSYAIQSGYGPGLFYCSSQGLHGTDDGCV